MPSLQKGRNNTTTKFLSILFPFLLKIVVFQHMSVRSPSLYFKPETVAAPVSLVPESSARDKGWWAGSLIGR